MLQTTLVVTDAEATAEQLRKDNYDWISLEVAEMPNAWLRFQKEFLVRDSDGHVMRIAEY